MSCAPQNAVFGVSLGPATERVAIFCMDMLIVGENREKWDAGETRHAHFSGKTTSKLDFLVMTISIS